MIPILVPLISTILDGVNQLIFLNGVHHSNLVFAETTGKLTSSRNSWRPFSPSINSWLPKHYKYQRTSFSKFYHSLNLITIASGDKAFIKSAAIFARNTVNQIVPVKVSPAFRYRVGMPFSFVSFRYFWILILKCFLKNIFYIKVKTYIVETLANPP